MKRSWPILIAARIAATYTCHISFRRAQAFTTPGYAARGFRSWKGSFLALASGLADRARQHMERSRLRQEAADDRVRHTLYRAAQNMRRNRPFMSASTDQCLSRSVQYYVFSFFFFCFQNSEFPNIPLKGFFLLV